MRLFIDENISPVAERIFESLGHDVTSIHARRQFGIKDDEVFRIAQNEERVLITQNGRHFIVFVVPFGKQDFYYGIVWLKTELTKVNARQICYCINELFKKFPNINNSIWELKRNSERQFILNKKN